ncbi:MULTISPECIES: hypothetical protein [unclassified Pseudomonas]|uniref:hypothetical protein n=1 Tax=unclassified Pseudomonas TaxID=196821 RepID=UPI002AC92F61|nr:MULTISPECIES: hypothetical protein [unclassified Pseudomonas]MEB0042294.1 hypothetical protein [Pseudomonas sp. MH10]MEB0077942.1 hypothetical protein [Pseudomonas sp. MH10out]MEB0094055.1 hypothetical protein [Pseudomonas sp. CCI4.2]MEB0101656.1 hypothetical protein [Pseudomonas sp. CCI3.2]MEB0122639.1 hypothetical protein [Pseudomonas sp. CCI1.2]
MTDTQDSTDIATDTATATPATEPEPILLPWADVQPDQFQMLRLAPLPTHRITGIRPLRFVQFGRVERHSKEISLLRLDIQLPGQRVRKEQNHMDVWVDHLTHRIRIFPDAGLQIEPWNRGIGRYMAAYAASWARKRWSHYTVDGITLANKDALNDDTRLRRDNFLKAQGFEVAYADAQHMKGTVKEVLMGQLHSTWNNDKLQLLEIVDAANMLEQAESNLQEQDLKLRQNEVTLTRFKREDTGLRFTIACLVTFAVFQAAMLIWIATHR